MAHETTAAAARDTRLVALLGLAQVVSWGVLYYGFSLFVLPMRDELGWSPTLINGALTGGLLVTAAAAYPVATLIERCGGRRVMSAGSLLAVLALLAWSMATSPAQFYLAWAAIGLAMAAVLYEPAFVVLNLHFGVHARRAIVTLTLIAGFASTLFMPLTETLLGYFDWRVVLRILALVVAAVTWPIHLLVVPGHHAAQGTQGSGVATASGCGIAAGAGATAGGLRQRLRDPVFWGLTLWFTAWSGTASGLMFQLVPYLKSAGVAPATLLWTVALVGPSQVAGRVLLMLGGERVGTLGVAAFTTTLTPLAVLVLILAPPELPWLASAAIGFGLANGINTILRGAVPAEWLGTAGIARVMGAMGTPMMLAAALAPLVTAAAWSASGDVRAMQWLVFACAVAGAAGFWLAALSRRRRSAPAMG